MPRRLSRSQRLVTAAVWPFGIALTSWDYMWRITPLHRRELAGTMDRDGPPPPPPGASLEDAQLSDAGVGPLFHRRYQARIAKPKLTAEQLMQRIVADPDDLAPKEFARFKKVQGEQGQMAEGDEYVVRMPGPWDGAVRVAKVTPRSFRFVTLAGHLEAGQIEFRTSWADSASTTKGGHLIFEIYSVARSADRAFSALYSYLPVAREMQLFMWVHFCCRVAEMAKGTVVGKPEVRTVRYES